MPRTEALPALQLARAPERGWVRGWRLGGQDHLRCKGSRFGQFRITLSLAFVVAGIGAVYAEVLNPFAAFPRVVSEPLLGRVPAPGTFLTVVVALGVLSLVASACPARFRARIVSRP